MNPNQRPISGKSNASGATFISHYTNANLISNSITERKVMRELSINGRIRANKMNEISRIYEDEKPTLLSNSMLSNRL